MSLSGVLKRPSHCSISEIRALVMGREQDMRNSMRVKFLAVTRDRDDELAKKWRDRQMLRKSAADLSGWVTPMMCEWARFFVITTFQKLSVDGPLPDGDVE